MPEIDFDILAPLLALTACSWLVWRRFAAHRQARRMLGKPVRLPENPHSDPRLYYCWSPHCGMCKGMNRLVDRLRESGFSLIKVNVMEQTDIARRLGIAATPSFVLVRNGQIDKVLIGPQSEQRLLELLNNHDQL